MCDDLSRRIYYKRWIKQTSFIKRCVKEWIKCLLISNSLSLQYLSPKIFVDKNINIWQDLSKRIYKKKCDLIFSECNAKQIIRINMRWKKVVKEHLTARTRSTSDLPSTNVGMKWATSIIVLEMVTSFVCNGLVCTKIWFFIDFSGNLGERIDARLHDLSQLQLEDDGKRTHNSREKFSKNKR